MKVLISMLVFVSVVGCSSAKKSSEIQSVRVPVAPYLKMDCKELSTEQSSLIRDAESVGASVDKAYDSDKTKEVVAWILFAPAALFFDGNQEQGSKLASIKGQMESVQEAMKINKCVGNS